MNDNLGDRMKSYENVTRNFISKRSNVIIRIDGKAFHTYTRGLKKPFDYDLHEDMDKTTKYLLSNIQGAKLAYVQSDEISLILTDYDTFTTEAWFGNNIQKMCSISASMTTSEFNKLRIQRNQILRYNDLDFDPIEDNFVMANFDSRVFSVPDLEEVSNYLIWRTKDATRNSIQMVARSLFSQKQLHGKNCSDLIELCKSENKPWESFTSRSKHGGLFVKSSDGIKEIGIPDDYSFNFFYEIVKDVCFKTS